MATGRSRISFKRDQALPYGIIDRRLPVLAGNELGIGLPPADTESARSLYRKMEQELAFNPRSKMGV